MSDTEELHVRDFNPLTYEHVLPEGAHDFNEYDSEYEEQHPELGSQMNKLRQRWQNWILRTRSFTKNTVTSWTLTIASMAKSSKCQT